MITKDNTWQAGPLREKVVYWFDKVLRNHYKAPASFKVTAPNGDGSFDNCGHDVTFNPYCFVCGKKL